MEDAANPKAPNPKENPSCKLPNTDFPVFWRLGIGVL
jgi:hypothetical protein